MLYSEKAYKAIIDKNSMTELSSLRLTGRESGINRYGFCDCSFLTYSEKTHVLRAHDTDGQVQFICKYKEGGFDMGDSMQKFDEREAEKGQPLSTMSTEAFEQLERGHEIMSNYSWDGSSCIFHDESFLVYRRGILSAYDSASRCLMSQPYNETKIDACKTCDSISSYKEENEYSTYTRCAECGTLRNVKSIHVGEDNKSEFVVSLSQYETSQELTDALNAEYNRGFSDFGLRCPLSDYSSEGSPTVLFLAYRAGWYDAREKENPPINREMINKILDTVGSFCELGKYAEQIRGFEKEEVEE